MLTKTNPDGTWSCQGVDFKELKGNMYGALCKLHDYEKSGLEPNDLYKVKRNIHIGSSINGHIVFGVWNSFFIAEHPHSAYPYCVWKIAPDGFEVFFGYCFVTRAEAEKKFFELASGAEPCKTEYWKR